MDQKSKTLKYFQLREKSCWLRKLFNHCPSCHLWKIHPTNCSFPSPFPKERSAIKKPDAFRFPPPPQKPARRRVPSIIAKDAMPKPVPVLSIGKRLLKGSVDCLGRSFAIKLNSCLKVNYGLLKRKILLPIAERWDVSDHGSDVQV